MANKKLTELTAITSLDGDELLLIADDPGGTPVSKSVTVNKLLYPIRLVQGKAASAQVSSVTLDATPTQGNSLILFTNATTGQVTNVACTNVTWTQLKTQTSGGGSYYAIWAGIIGASAGTQITMTLAGTYNSLAVIEVEKTLTPTMGVNTSGTGGAFGDITLTGITKGNLVVAAYGADNTLNGAQIRAMSYSTGVLSHIACSLLATISEGNPVYCNYSSNGTAGGYIACEIT